MRAIGIPVTNRDLARADGKDSYIKSENLYRVPTVLKSLGDPRLSWTAYLAAIALGLIVAGSVIALLLSI